MKNNLLLISFVVLSSARLFSQIPNAGFEDWANNDPVGWFTYDVILGDAVTQSSDSHSGSSAAKMQIIDFFGSSLPPWLTSGTFTVSEKPGSLTGYYKFVPKDANQSFGVAIIMYQAAGYAGGGSWEIDQAVSSYTQFTVPIEYYPPDVFPDSAYIQFYVSDASEGTEGIGAYALIDDLSFGGFVGVKEIVNKQTPTSYELMQNYPNPFNPSTKIEYSIPEESFVQLKVYNLIGQEVATLVNQNQKVGTYRADFNAEGMNSGIYIAKLNANGFTKSVKMTLLK